MYRAWHTTPCRLQVRRRALRPAPACCPDGMAASGRRATALGGALSLLLLAAPCAVAAPTVLASADEFVAALRSPATQHVELTRHLDLSAEGVNCVRLNGAASIFSVGPGLGSIRVCAAPRAGPVLRCRARSVVPRRTEWWLPAQG